MAGLEKHKLNASNVDYLGEDAKEEHTYVQSCHSIDTRNCLAGKVSKGLQG